MPSPSSSPTPRVRPERRLIEHRFDDEDPAAGPDGERKRIGRPGIDLDGPAVVLEEQAGVERLLGQRRDDDPIDAGTETLEGRREEVVGQRTIRSEALELHRDRARLPWPDPDREIPIPLRLLEDDDMPARQHVDPDALDHHLDELRPGERLLAGHGLIIPRRPGGSGPSSRRPRASVAPRTTSATTTPATNPPMWAKKATPPSAPASPSEPMPSMSWSTNQNPSTMRAGTSISW